MKTRNILILAMSTALMAGFASTSQAVEQQTYGACWAWNNNFNDPGNDIQASFASGSYPGITIDFNFGTGNLYGYPAICRGWHYGYNATGDTLFPAQLSTLSSIPCQFGYDSGGSNMKGDFTYDTFLRWDNAKSSPQCEVMVWGGSSSWPIGNLTGTAVLTTGGITWDIYEGYNQAAGYEVYSFVPTGSIVWPENSLPTSGSLNVDLLPFYQWLNNNRSSEGYFNINMYLDVVECGFEVCDGDGWCYMGGWINATSGSSGGIQNGHVYKLKNANSGKVLGIQNMSTSNNANAVQWDDNGTSDHNWTLTQQGDGNYKLKNANSGKVLGIQNMSTSDGADAMQWDDSGTIDHEWTLEFVQ